MGWQLQILSGAEEAACSFAGAASVLPQGANTAQVAVLDVGGGSTELICRRLAAVCGWARCACLMMRCGRRSCRNVWLSCCRPMVWLAWGR